jgi:hypothetical protein
MGKVDLWDAFDDTDGPHFNLSVDLTLVRLWSLYYCLSGRKQRSCSR